MSPVMLIELCSEQVGDGFDVHAAFEPADNGRVPQGVHTDTVVR